jgi:hypothetical protein
MEEKEKFIKYLQNYNRRKTLNNRTVWLKARVGIGLEVMRLELKMIILPESNRY